MIVSISQEKFLSNPCNKKNFISMLVKLLKTAKITTKQARDDAGVLIIDTAIAESKRKKTAAGIVLDLKFHDREIARYQYFLMGKSLLKQGEISRV